MEITCICINPGVFLSQLMNTYDGQIINSYKQYTFILVNVWELREYILKYPFLLGCSQLVHL